MSNFAVISVMTVSILFAMTQPEFLWFQPNYFKVNFVPFNDFLSLRVNFQFFLREISNGTSTMLTAIKKKKGCR
jgi:hypothetical protein